MEIGSAVQRLGQEGLAEIGNVRFGAAAERGAVGARVWGKSGFEGQHVGREHPVADGDVVELHV
ncbi:MAG: TGS domain-containing protein [Arenimonas sp.]